MSVPVQEAAEALAPFLAAGGDAAMREIAKQTGTAAHKAAVRVIKAIRGSLKGGSPCPEEIENALRAGLADGTVDEAEIRTLAASINVSGDTIQIGKVEGGFYTKNIFNVNVSGKPRE